MAFWKKSEDPWDLEPDKRRPAAEEEEAEKGSDDGSLLQDLRAWNETRKAEKARRETPPVPIPCPWCGKDMLGGYLYTGRDAIVWARKRPGFLSVDRERLRIDDEGGVFSSYKTAWRCESCEKLVLDTTGMRRMGEDRYVGPFTETKEEEPNETREEDSNHNGTALL